MSLCPPLDAHDAPSDRPDRLPALAQFPDSPSVYSHAYPSPRPDVLPGTPSFSRPSDLAASPDFDDETASTTHTLSATDVQDESDHDDCTEDASHRMSLQGPRIRFHSRAPWETDDVVPHAEQSDSNARSTTVGSKLRGKASRADTFIRTLTRGSSITSRPSIDSARSQPSASSSFDMTAGNYSSSRGALYHLAKESVSTSSFSSSATSASVRQRDFAHTNNHSNFAQAYASLSRAAASLDGMTPSATLDRAPAPPSSYDTSRIVQEGGTDSSMGPSPQKRPSRDKFVHPYANPDLVVPYTPSPEMIPSHLISGDMNGSDSNSTFADSTSIRSAAFSVISTQTSATSLISRDLTHGHRRVNGKEISSPISVLHPNDSGYVDRNTKFLSLHPPPTGFDVPLRGNHRSPAVALISLQEAQARERMRSNTAHSTVARSKPPFPSPDGVPERTEDEPEETDTVDALACTRARSTSTGTRYGATSIPSTQPPISENGEETSVSRSTNAVPGRALKHKKSGFMRLFAGRNSEEEKERSPPPSMPSLVDAYAKQSMHAHVTGKTSRSTLSRVPNPSLPQTLHTSGASNSTLASTNSTLSEGDGINGKGASSRRRQPPPLSIVTKAPDHSVSSSTTARSSPTGLSLTSPPPTSLSVSQSAPPGDTDFPGLKLRPVSTSFSSHFADMVVTTLEELRQDVHTPSSATSSSTALSPFTPISTHRSDDASAAAVEVQGEECPITKALRDQFTSAQKAWQQQIWELHGRIRDLTSELEDLRAAGNQEYCGVCGRGKPRGRHASSLAEQQPKKVGIVNRPRARTGDTARFASGN